jgi:MFS superfamily sulfate permease-like transporter
MPIAAKSHEVFALSLANVLAGALGGMPSSCGTARTMLNIQNGAHSRAAGLVNALCLIILAYAFAPAVSLLPVPIMASMQALTGIRQINAALFAQYWKSNKTAFFLSRMSYPWLVAFEF